MRRLAATTLLPVLLSAFMVAEVGCGDDMGSGGTGGTGGSAGGGGSGGAGGHAGTGGSGGSAGTGGSGGSAGIDAGGIDAPTIDAAAIDAPPIDAPGPCEPGQPVGPFQDDFNDGVISSWATVNTDSSSTIAEVNGHLQITAGAASI